ncbi:MAG: hypoxanthine phosphoribosyltransferase [Planctomycetota bacterium]
MAGQGGERVPDGGYPAPPPVPVTGIAAVYIDEQRIRRRVAALAAGIAADSGAFIHAIVILKGGVVFATDLFREIARIRPVDIFHSFMKASSYGMGDRSGGTVHLSHDSHPIRDQDILIVEDIIDSGRTVARLKEHLLTERGAKSVRVCVLLDKHARRLPEFDRPLDYCGFVVADRFLVGYGLDYAEHFRHLPYLALVDQAAVDAQDGKTQ